MLRILCVLSFLMASSVAGIAAPTRLEGFAGFVGGLGAPAPLTGMELFPLVQNGSTTATPLSTLDAYVNSNLPSVATQQGYTSVNKAGDTMLGLLKLQAPLINENDAGADTTANSQNRLSHVPNVAAVAGWANTGFPILVDGYASPGDGGRHPMTYDPVNMCGAGGHPAADGVTCINSTVPGQSGSWNIDPNFVPSFYTFGARCNSTGVSGNGNDDTSAIQAAINYSVATGHKIHQPASPTVCRTTTPLTAKPTGAQTAAAAMIEGEYCVKQNQNAAALSNGFTSSVAPSGPGSWLFFDHAGTGIQTGGAGNTDFTVGVDLVNICTMRNQPAVTSNTGTFTPNANGFDVQALDGELVLNHVFFLNPTKAIDITGGARYDLTDISGQPLTVGLEIDLSTDTGRLRGMHWWPFWSYENPVTNWTLSNLDYIVLGRTDNPDFEDIFGLQGHNGIHFIAQGNNGSVNKLHIGRADFDGIGGSALQVDSGAYTPTFDIDSLTAQGYGAPPSGINYSPTNDCIHIDGVVPTGTIKYLRCDFFNGGLVSIVGAPQSGLNTFLNIGPIYAGQKAYNTQGVYTSTTTAASNNSTSLSVSSAALAHVGQLIIATGIPFNTTIAAISGTTLTLSNTATVASGATVTYLSPAFSVASGVVLQTYGFSEVPTYLGPLLGGAGNIRGTLLKNQGLSVAANNGTTAMVSSVGYNGMLTVSDASTNATAYFVVGSSSGIAMLGQSSSEFTTNTTSPSPTQIAVNYINGQGIVFQNGSNAAVSLQASFEKNGAE